MMEVDALNSCKEPLKCNQCLLKPDCNMYIQNEFCYYNHRSDKVWTPTI